VEHKAVSSIFDAHFSAVPGTVSMALFLTQFTMIRESASNVIQFD